LSYGQLGVQFEFIASASEIALEFAKRLVFFVAHASHRQAHLFTDLGHGPTAGPEFNDLILTSAQNGLPSSFENLSELLAIPLTLVKVRTRGKPIIERLESLGTLDAFANHVDGPDELATLRGVVSQDEIQVELADPGFTQEPTADFLGAIFPETWIQPRVSPTDGAVSLDVLNQFRLGGMRGQGGQTNDQRHGRGTSAEGTVPLQARR